MIRRALPLVLVLACACRQASPTSPPPQPPDASVAAAQAEPTPALPKVPADAFAVVDGVALPLVEFQAIYDLQVAKYRDRGREITASEEHRHRKSISERLIYHEVLRQAADKLGVSPDPDVIELRVEHDRRNVPDVKLHMQRRGESEHSLREMYAAEERERLIVEHRGELAVKPEEIVARYNETKDELDSDRPQVRVSHILVPHETPDAERRAKAIWERAVKPGVDFAALARETSSGGAKLGGGELGLVSEGLMPQSFVKAAFATADGAVSEPVRTSDGWHIIKVAERLPAGVLPLKAVEADIRERLARRKFHDARGALKHELIAKAQIIEATTRAPDPEPPSAAPPRSLEPVGVAACDTLVADWAACVNRTYSEAERELHLGVIASVARDWRVESEAPDGRAKMRSLCESVRESMRDVMTAQGCSWPGQ